MKYPNMFVRPPPPTDPRRRPHSSPSHTSSGPPAPRPGRSVRSAHHPPKQPAATSDARTTATSDARFPRVGHVGVASASYATEGRAPTARPHRERRTPTTCCPIEVSARQVPRSVTTAVRWCRHRHHNRGPSPCGCRRTRADDGAHTHPARTGQPRRPPHGRGSGEACSWISPPRGVADFLEMPAGLRSRPPYVYRSERIRRNEYPNMCSAGARLGSRRRPRSVVASHTRSGSPTTRPEWMEPAHTTPRIVPPPRPTPHHRHIRCEFPRVVVTSACQRLATVCDRGNAPATAAAGRERRTPPPVVYRGQSRRRVLRSDDPASMVRHRHRTGRRPSPWGSPDPLTTSTHPPARTGQPRRPSARSRYVPAACSRR